eukprot:Gb_30999 [translate_table: standard]
MEIGIVKRNIFVDARVLFSNGHIDDLIDGTSEIIISEGMILPSLSKDCVLISLYGRHSWIIGGEVREGFPSILSIVSYRGFGVDVYFTRLTNSSFSIMGGDPVMTELSVLKIKDDVKELLDKIWRKVGKVQSPWRKSRIQLRTLTGVAFFLLGLL